MSLFKKSNDSPPARVKMMLWGESGSGKTTGALTWPTPMVVDFREKGSGAYWGDFDFSYLQANTIDEVVAAISEASNGGHGCSTFILDPWSLLCEAIVDKWTAHYRRLKKDPYAELQPQEYRGPKNEVKRILRMLQGLDMNVILVCRSKANFVSKWNNGKGKMELAVDGIKADALGDLRYEVDLSIRLESLPDKAFQWNVEKFRGSKFSSLPTQHTYQFGQFYGEFSKFVGNKEAMESESVSTIDKTNPQSALFLKLKDIGLGDFSTQYDRYLREKYGLDDTAEMAPENLTEQRKILNSLVGNQERIEKFKSVLNGEGESNG